MTYFITVLMALYGSPVPKNAVLEFPVGTTQSQCEEAVTSELRALNIGVIRVKCEQSIAQKDGTVGDPDLAQR